ncbi:MULTISPECIES: type II secretion system F family protein [Halorhodospira]|uniref:type II secretion system F family protein n=1 Tax=Halorhodospira TaxID=85108 RepID=UPI001EE7F47B|nr:MULTISPECIES: type II secretion system F family protein [Halorhodospira]MCG5528641.1 type II secretion system F family protein [Halorhodospira halophila]MCG5543968.1 type II secretion system F family protein [Halorhodospira sp. 9628]
MPNFRYRGRAQDGREVQGRIEAPNRDGAIDEVLSRGVTPISVEAAGGDGGGGSGLNMDLTELLEQYNIGQKVTLEELVTFVRQLSALLHAGVPIIRCLRGLAESGSNKRLNRALEEIAASLESGQSLSQAMGRHDDIFPTLLIAMVRVGEDSGQLEESLNRMAENLEQERVTRQRVKQALRYPTFVFIAIAIALVVVNIFVIPAFSDIFEQMGADLPAATVALITTSEFMEEQWLYLLIGAVGAYFAARAYLRSENGRYLWDRFKLRLPGIGKILQLALLARFGRTFSMAVRSGVPLLQAMDSVAEATDNAYIGRGIRTLRDGIEQGESLHQVSVRSGLFTPLVLQMLAVGEETGQVADMMDHVADFYEREVEADLEKLSSYIEPFVIGFIALLVLVLAAGIFLPMWQLGTEAL